MRERERAGVGVVLGGGVAGVAGVASKESFISGSAKGQIVLRSAQGPNETVGVDTIDAEGGGRVRRRYDVLKERDSARNPTLLDVELMDCAACLDIDVPGRNGLKALIRWNFLSHNWVSGQGFSCPCRKANHPMKP